LNEDLAATAVWGTQQVGLSTGVNRDGVLGVWYGKGPGVDRSGDVLKHANAAGSSAYGGVLAIAGDDHTCKSSSIPHQSDHAFISALMPMLYPSSVHEFIEYGLLGIAMSRFSGCWVGFKVISDTVETTTVIDLAQEARTFITPEDFILPPGGLNLRWPDPPLIQDERLQEQKGYAAIAFARANKVDEITFNSTHARFGIVASGKAYEDVRQALRELGLGPSELQAAGLRLYKVRMPWPLEPQGIRQFSEGLEEVLIVEERREIIENQIKQQLFNWRPDVRPRIIGKFDLEDKPFLSLSKGLSVSSVARAIANRLMRFELPEGLSASVATKLAAVEAREHDASAHTPPITRLPHYCAGCPHNTSTRVPEGSKAMAGIGCHFMAQWMDRNTETFTHMGAEGVPWTAISRYTSERHRFANIGDGTYFHSGILAIRQSVATKTNITYKVLYNDAVAMTGGQQIDGQLTPQQVTHQLFYEGVAPIYLLSDRPDLYTASTLAPGVIVRHRDEIDNVMLELREIPGCSAIVYEQTCAAEKRRRRKRKVAPDSGLRLFINPAACEGCGDCSTQSNCVAIEPQETEFGRKRKINQSACNKDYSCLKGFCPSFVTVRGGRLKKHSAAARPEVTTLPPPLLPPLDQPWNIVVTGVGGTGVLTIGALLGMAAHIEGKSPLILDMAGLAQKGGAVLSHIRLSTREDPATSPKISNGGVDLLLAADGVVASSKESIALCDPSRTNAVMNTKITPVSEFVRHRDFDFKQSTVERTVAKSVNSSAHFYDFSSLALSAVGDEIASNIMMLGYAWQKGLIPLDARSIEQSIRLNGVAADSNIDAFNWGRLLAHDPAQVLSLSADGTPVKPQDQMSLEDLIRHRMAHLTAYQDDQLAQRYRQLVERVEVAAHSAISRDADRARLIRTVAKSYAKLLSYKDEYEVARLFTHPAFAEAIGAQFDGDFRIAFNLAPPMLSGTAANGRPRKREFGGATTMVLFRLLARLKRLRGTPLDLFGYTAERCMERHLITQYEHDVDAILADLNDSTVVVASALLSLPDEIRGFGPVKQEAVAKAETRRKELIAQLSGRDERPTGQVAAE
jgi:indolepyruvate ferredoxin oxidoreductase